MPPVSSFGELAERVIRCHRTVRLRKVGRAPHNVHLLPYLHIMHGHALEAAVSHPVFITA